VGRESRPVFGKLGGHARADAGDQHEFFPRARVQIYLHEGSPVELANLIAREFLLDQDLVHVDDALEWTLFNETFDGGRRHAGQSLQFAFGRGIEIRQRFAGLCEASGCERCRGRDDSQKRTNGAKHVDHFNFLL